MNKKVRLISLAVVVLIVVATVIILFSLEEKGSKKDANVDDHLVVVKQESVNTKEDTIKLFDSYYSAEENPLEIERKDGFGCITLIHDGEIYMLHETEVNGNVEEERGNNYITPRTHIFQKHSEEKYSVDINFRKNPDQYIYRVIVEKNGKYQYKYFSISVIY